MYRHYLPEDPPAAAASVTTAAPNSEAERVYEPTLAHLPPPAPEPIEGEMVGVYGLRGDECAEHFIRADRFCIHEAVANKPETDAAVAAYARGSAPPLVRLFDGRVTWAPSSLGQR